jgi:hypothetical protein
MNIDSLGGRKFVLTVLCVAVGTAVEITTTRGVSPAFAGLLAALVAAFGAANAYNTNQALKASTSPDDNAPTGPTMSDLDAIHDNMTLLISKVEDVAKTAITAGELANSHSDQIADAVKLAKAALKVNQG